MAITNRGVHPDFNPDGTMKADALVRGTSARDRDFNRMMADPVQREHVTAMVAQAQRQLPLPVQQYVQGRIYAPGGTPAQGLRDYAAVTRGVNAEYAQLTGNPTGLLVDRDIPYLSDAEYDRFVDERGQVREGALVWFTDRAVPIDDTMDPWTRAELLASRR